MNCEDNLVICPPDGKTKLLGKLFENNYSGTGVLFRGELHIPENGTKIHLRP
jgi:hypothetical protein